MASVDMLQFLRIPLRLRVQALVRLVSNAGVNRGCSLGGPVGWAYIHTNGVYVFYTIPGYIFYIICVFFLLRKPLVLWFQRGVYKGPLRFRNTAHVGLIRLYGLQRYVIYYLFGFWTERPVSTHPTHGIMVFGSRLTGLLFQLVLAILGGGYGSSEMCAIGPEDSRGVSCPITVGICASRLVQ